MGTPREALCLPRLQGGPGRAPGRERPEAAVRLLQPAGSHGQLRGVSLGSGGWLGARFTPAGDLPHPRTDHALSCTASAGPRPTALRVLPSDRSRLWLWTCSLRPCTVRCSFCLRGWSTLMVRGPWSPRNLWSKPHQHPQVTPHRKPGSPPLLRGCGNQPSGTMPGLPQAEPGVLKARLGTARQQPQRPPSPSLTHKRATRARINKCGTASVCDMNLGGRPRKAPQNWEWRFQHPTACAAQRCRAWRPTTPHGAQRARCRAPIIHLSLPQRLPLLVAARAERSWGPPPSARLQPVEDPQPQD